MKILACIKCVIGATNQIFFLKCAQIEIGYPVVGLTWQDDK